MVFEYIDKRDTFSPWFYLICTRTLHTRLIIQLGFPTVGTGNIMPLFDRFTHLFILSILTFPRAQ